MPVKGAPLHENRAAARRTRLPHLETSIAPLFASLSRRMLARFKKYSGGQIALIETFLTDGANEMREEAAKLPVLRSSTIKSVRAARVHRKQGP
jgi:hypothetical protein